MNPKDAFHKTVHAAPGGVEALAVRMGMTAAVLRNKANPNHSYNRPTLDDVDLAMGITGDHSVLHALAQNHGFVCVRMEQEGSASDQAVLEMIARIWQGEGEVGTEVNQALADGRITKRELEKVRDAVTRLEGALEGMVVRLAGMAER